MKGPLAVLCASLVFILMLAAACRSQTVSTLPDLTLPNVRGGAFPLRGQPARPLLLAFLQTVPDTADTPSRSQVVFLASMAQQYGPRGLRVAIVDASVLAPGSQPSHLTGVPGDRSSSLGWSYDAVLNASYDWHLNFPLLLDKDGQLARQLGVKEVPTTFLIDVDGTIVQRWQGLTRPAVLAQGIERLVGGPLGQAP
jgi:hypothetical protein